LSSSSLQQSIQQKTIAGERLTSQEGLYLIKEAPLLWLGHTANQVRRKRFPCHQVTFVMDTNPNYTNICDTDCTFCAFYRRPQDADSYTLSVDDIMKKIERVSPWGVTTVLLQGGHNRALKLDYYLALVRETKKRFPHITPHFFTASEIHTISEVEGLTIQQVLAALKAAGQTTLPGGGAEILSDRVRQKYPRRKAG